MKKAYLILLFTLLIFCSAFAGVKEAKRTEVNIPKMGFYQSETVDTYQSVNCCMESDAKMDGKGFWGKLIAKTFPNGKQTTIHNLNEKMTYVVDFEKKKYTKNPIEKLVKEEGEEESGKAEEKEEAETEQRFRIIRQEFKVTDTEKDQKTGQFDTHQYQIMHLVEKEEISTQKRYTDSLLVDVFTTKNEDLFAKAGKEKEAYIKAMMEAIGFETGNDSVEQMMGLNWIATLKMADVSSPSDTSDFKIDLNEFKKMKGYPVKVDGKYSSREFDPNLQVTKTEEKKGLSGFGFGSIMDKAAESVKESKEEKKAAENNKYKLVLSFMTETKSVEFIDLAEGFFAPPAGFKEVKKL